MSNEPLFRCCACGEGFDEDTPGAEKHLGFACNPDYVSTRKFIVPFEYVKEPEDGKEETTKA